MVKAFSNFKQIESLPSSQEKARAWLKDYEGLHYGFAENGNMKAGWEWTKSSYKDALWEPSINMIGRLPNRTIIEFDGDPDLAKKHLDQTQARLKEIGLGHIRSTHYGKSDYLWVEFKRPVSDKEIEAFFKWIAPEGSTIDLNFASSNKIFPILFAPHRKHPYPEKPIEFFEGDQIDYDLFDIPQIKGKSKTSTKEGFPYKTFVKPLNDKEVVFEYLSDKQLSEHKCEEGNNWLINHFVRPKTVCIMAGKRSTLKSMFALWVAYHVSEGIKLLDQFDVSQVPVLYLDRENGYSELQSRTSMIKKGLNISESANLYYLSEQHLKLDAYSHLESLEQFIKEKGIKLVIGDTFRRLITFEENSADETSRFFVDLLKPLCERTGVSFLLLHHEKKGKSEGDDMDMLRGSSDLVNYADTIIQLERKGNKIIVKQTKQRGAKELEPFIAKFESDEHSFMKFLYGGEKQELSDIVSKSLVSWILDNGVSKFTYKEGLDYCKALEYSKDSYGKALESLSNKGLISKGPNKFDPYIVSTDLTEASQ